MGNNNNKYREVLKNIVSNSGYIVGLVAICTIIIMLIVNFGTTMQFVGRLIEVIMPFVIGFLVYYLINPLVTTFQTFFNKIKPGKWLRVKRAVAVLISYSIIVGIIILIIVYISPQIKDSVKEMGNSVTTGYTYLDSNKDKLNSDIPFIRLGDIMDYIKNNLFSMFDYEKLSTSIVPYVYKFSSSVFSVVYNFLIGLVISVYIVLDNKRLARGLKRIVYALTPKHRAEGAWNTLLECNHIFNGFLFGKAIDSLIIGILCLIVMSILRLPYALLMSLIVGVTNMIPYFGPILGAVPGVLIYLFIDPKMSLIFAVMIFILQQFDGLYLGPKILGDLTGIKPLWVIFGVTVGGAYFGVMGMFLGVPAVAVLVYLFNLFIEKKLNKKGIQLFDSK